MRRLLGADLAGPADMCCCAASMAEGCVPSLLQGLHCACDVLIFSSTFPCISLLVLLWMPDALLLRGLQCMGVPCGFPGRSRYSLDVARVRGGC